MSAVWHRRRVWDGVVKTYRHTVVRVCDVQGGGTTRALAQSDRAPQQRTPLTPLNFLNSLHWLTNLG